MPLVLVRHRSNVDDETLDRLAAELPQAVASAYDCDDPGGSLSADDIEVHFSEMTERDRCEFPIIVEVEAMGFPQRRRNLPQRTRQLGEAIRTLAEPYEFGLWPKLVTAGWFSSIE